MFQLKSWHMMSISSNIGQFDYKLMFSDQWLVANHYLDVSCAKKPNLLIFGLTDWFAMHVVGCRIRRSEIKFKSAIMTLKVNMCYQIKILQKLQALILNWFWKTLYFAEPTVPVTNWGIQCKLKFKFSWGKPSCGNIDCHW